MIIARTKKEVIENVKKWKEAGESIGLVPTMGYLHEGHASLIKRAREENDRVIVSDFVNPTQFGPNEDLDTYPRDFDMDCKLCEEIGADLIFHPEPSDMYEDDRSTGVSVKGLTAGLCGASRPGHFDGVCLVVNKLFNISRADRGYFGQKDAQQLAVIRRMVRDLDMPIEIVACPIIREEDGLAKSSRNVRLNPQERAEATILHRALCEAVSAYEAGERSTDTLEKLIRKTIVTVPVTDIDYVEIVTWDGLEKVDTITGPVLMAVAVRIGSVRLIDNMIVGGNA